MSINLLADIFRMRKQLPIPAEIESKFTDESVCRRCGQCCYSSVMFRNRLTIIPDLPCKHLLRQSDNSTLCAIYSSRQQVSEWCNHMTPQTVNAGLFPEDCPYVRDIPGYSGKGMVSESDREEFYLWLSRSFPDMTPPEYISAQDWERFLAILSGVASAHRKDALRLR